MQYLLTLQVSTYCLCRGDNVLQRSKDAHSEAYTGLHPATRGHSPNAVSMLFQRRRRWAKIETALGEFPVFPGMCRPVMGGPIHTVSCLTEPHQAVGLPTCDYVIGYTVT